MVTPLAVVAPLLPNCSGTASLPEGGPNTRAGTRMYASTPGVVGASAHSSATNASSVLPPPKVVSHAPSVVGKSAELLYPATTVLPGSRTSMLVPVVDSLPPR